MGRHRPKPPTVIGSSTLDPWLARTAALPLPAHIQGILPNQELGGWVGIETWRPLHLVEDLPAQSLGQSAQQVHDYLHSAMKLIGSDEPGWLDKEEAEMIRAELGPPPPRCLSLYLISVGTDATERLVYAGRTSASVSRFRAGHSVTTRLHAPEYTGHPKHIYLASVMLIAGGDLLADAGDYLPLEWISPVSVAEELLESIEKALIYQLEPELNRNLRKSYRPKRDVSISIQNFCEDSDFLDSKLISPLPFNDNKRGR